MFTLVRDQHESVCIKELYQNPTRCGTCNKSNSIVKKLAFKWKMIGSENIYGGFMFTRILHNFTLKISNDSFEDKILIMEKISIET